MKTVLTSGMQNAVSAIPLAASQKPLKSWRVMFPDSILLPDLFCKELLNNSAFNVLYLCANCR